MPQFRAAWLLPITQPPIRDAWLVTAGGRVVDFGPSRPGRTPPPDEIDLGAAAVMPGLVNAHTHLELSRMRGLVPETDDFPGWIRSVMALRREQSFSDEGRRNAVGAAIDESRRFGTALVGDISNSLSTSKPLADRRMPALVFNEVLGFKAELAESVMAAALGRLEQAPTSDFLRHSIAPHAPYSVSAALMTAVRTRLQKDPLMRTSIHLGESAAECEFVREGTGPWRRLLEDLGSWDASWVTPRCRPIEYIERMGLLDERLLVVHGVQFDKSDLARVAASGATLVTCPRGNLRTGAGTPPVAAFFGSAARVAIGTDSLASVPDLSIFEELAALRRLAPGVPARELLAAATINGARALGFERDFGSIEAGKRDHLIAVEIPRTAADVDDVEEHLVVGVTPAEIRWIDRTVS